MKTILIVEDDESLSYLMSLVFIDLYKCLQARTNLEAYRYLYRAPYTEIHIAIVDYVLATETVEPTVDILKSLRIPFLVTSAWRDIELQHNLPGAVAYIQKPYIIEDLMNTVQKHITM